MVKQDKLIITSTVAPSWIYPEAKNNPKTADDAIEEAISPGRRAPRSSTSMAG